MIALTTRGSGTPCETTNKPGLDFSASQPRTEMSKHGPAIMCHYDPAFLRGLFKDFRIADAFQTGVDCRSEVDAGFALADCFDDGVFEVGVRLEAQAQARGSPVFARARSSFSQSAGFACCNGRLPSSNSLSVRARYSSISARWSR